MARASERAGIRRLVMVTPGLDEVGGAAKRSALLAHGLARRGWQVRAITRSGTRRRPALIRAENLVAVEIPGFGAGRLGAIPFFVFGLPLAIVWGLRARAFLAIQLMSTATVAGVAATVTRRPWIAGSTTSGELSESAYILGRPTAPLRRRLFRTAAALLAQTPPAATELAALVRADRIHVVPNPVVVPDPVPGLTDSRSALFTGRFSEEKDLPLLLSAWREVAAADGQARLVLAGAGGAYRSVEAEVRATIAADPTLASSVTLPGWVPDVRPLLVSHDVYVFPSVSEGMSNSLLEACAYGRVVVASDIPSNLAVLGPDYPLLFRTGDGKALSQALTSALYDEDVRSAARRHLAVAITSSALDSVLDRIEALLLAASDAR